MKTSTARLTEHQEDALREGYCTSASTLQRLRARGLAAGASSRDHVRGWRLSLTPLGQGYRWALRMLATYRAESIRLARRCRDLEDQLERLREGAA